MMNVPKITLSHTNSTTDKDVCPMCKGRGYLVQLVNSRNYPEIYGDINIDLEFKKNCPKCKGYKPEIEDFTNAPDDCREADIYKFNFNAYSVDLSKIKMIAFDFFDNFKVWTDNGKGLYLYSKTCGSGKTFLACCLAKSVMMKYNIRFKFITVPDYIDKVSEGYSLAKQGIMDNPSRIYNECELLVLDDIGTQLDKPWQNQELFKLVNNRITSGLVTIYTSNLTIEQLNIDQRIKNRIFGSTFPIPMPEESIRIKHAQDISNDFFKGIESRAMK